MRFQLETENDGCDEILVGDSIEEVTQDVLNRYECDELPKHWVIYQLPVELAVKGQHGDWEFLGDFGDGVDAAKKAAVEYAKAGQLHIDDHGVMAFGITEDPAGGNYEIDFRVDTTTMESWEHPAS